MMKILLHVGVGNTIAPSRWNFVRDLFTDLARTLEALGHDCLLWVHPAANNVHPEKIFHKNIISEKVLPISYNPDWVFTWNGINDGDKQVIKMFGQNRMIYSELAFLDHYKSLYFDFSGVNSKSSNLFEKLMPYDDALYERLVATYKKERLYNKPFVFVPLQDENDTNITCYSPFKKMDDVLDYIETLYAKENIDILYKKHPISNCVIKPRNRFIEVTENVHYYLPYAEMVIGINSTVLIETLLYHNRIITTGLGLTSRPISSEIEARQYITHLYKKQMKWDDLKNVEFMEKSYLYQKMIK
jgi:hypothetical protein